MRKLFSLVAILLFAIGCGEKRPSDILPREKMQAVMWDMLKTGEFLDAYVLYKDSSLDKSATVTAWYDKIYQLHKITKSQFEKSYTYYQDHPALMKEMLDTLGKRQLTSAEMGIQDSTTVSKDSATAHKDSVAAKKDSVPAQLPVPVPTKPFTSPGTPYQKLNVPQRKVNRIDSLRRMRILQRKQFQQK